MFSVICISNIENRLESVMNSGTQDIYNTIINKRYRYININITGKTYIVSVMNFGIKDFFLQNNKLLEIDILYRYY